MKMRFSLFSKTEFEVSDPIALVECYCFQNDFYSAYHLLTKREVKHVNKIGARIPPRLLRKCKAIIDDTRRVGIFKYELLDLDAFLNLSDEAMRRHVEELGDDAIKRLTSIRGIGLSRATKVLHTLYPHIIPMIDSLLQDEYYRVTAHHCKKGDPGPILIAYYANLKGGPNRRQLDQLHREVSERGLSLTKVGVFDILWWSFLKAEKLKGDVRTKGGNLAFTTVKRL